MPAPLVLACQFKNEFHRLWISRFGDHFRLTDKLFFGLDSLSNSFARSPRCIYDSNFFLDPFHGLLLVLRALALRPLGFNKCFDFFFFTNLNGRCFLPLPHVVNKLCLSFHFLPFLPCIWAANMLRISRFSSIWAWVILRGSLLTHVIFPALNTWAALAKCTFSSKINYLRYSLTSSTCDNDSSMGTNWVSSVSLMSSYHDVIGMAHSVWKR